MIEVAKLIPAVERQEILKENLINKAVSIGPNEAMQHLAIIWQEYVEPNVRLTCNACYERILNNFKQLQPIFIELEKQDRLLCSV